jgi:phosphatidylserine/phosphatidylglycerophosphate/cardiolipin synthase-like enzyme
MARTSLRSFTALAVGVIGLGAVAIKTGRDYLAKPVVPGEVEVLFSPRGGCTEAIVRELRKAQRSICVQAYSFTHAEIAKALVDAHRRGVKVAVMLDKSQQTEKYSEADFTSNAGIPTSIDAAHAIAHNKIMIIDEATVITGSFNFSKAAEQRNAENLVIFHDSPTLAAKYMANWQAHAAHSAPYARKTEHARKK